MTLQASGAISLADVQVEFGGSNPIGINEYYGRATGIPGSGTISLYDFYGKSAAGAYTWTGFSMGYFYGNVATNQAYEVGTTITPGSGGSPATFIINNNTLSPGYLQLYVGGSLSITFSGAQTNTSHVSSFGSSSLQFRSTVVDTSSNDGARILTVYVGAVQVYYHETDFIFSGD